MAAQKKDYFGQIEILNSTLWEYRAFKPQIDEWLGNFDTQEEQEYALYLLSRMMYFSSLNIRYLLRTLYRDLYKYPIVEKIRKANGDTLDDAIIEQKFREERNKTRFFGVGNPADSGVHLLYYFRQENKIPKVLFTNTDDVTQRHTDGSLTLRPELRNADKFVFIDDICGTGKQATTDTNVMRCVSAIKSIKPKAKISYLMLFGMKDGVETVKKCGLYDFAEAVIELDDSYKCFGDSSRYFKNCEFDKNKAKQIAYDYGFRLIKEWMKRSGMSVEDQKKIADKNALGFGECQLLLSMHHNTPDNTLPIFWLDEMEDLWKPIFKRYNKI